MCPTMEQGKKVQPLPNKIKSKNTMPQTRISIKGSNNIPSMLVNQPKINTGNTSFKTFYNLNANNDYNYNIDSDNKDNPYRNMKPPAVEEAGESDENDDNREPSPAKQ